MLRDLARDGRGSADELFAAGVDGVATPEIYGWVREKALPGGRWRLTPPGLVERLPVVLHEARTRGRTGGELMLVSGRQLTRVNATHYVPARKSRDFPKVHIHPADAEKRQMRNGDNVSIRSANGQVVATLAVDDAVREGAVWLPHGWLEVNAGRLTSGADGVDPLTGQPEMTAITVTLARASAA